MNFYAYLKTKAKTIIGVSLLLSMLSLFVFPGGDIRAANPRFNFRGSNPTSVPPEEGDRELLLGRNLFQESAEKPAEQIWKDPVSGDPGDIFEAQIYYHNGEPDTIARNTVIKVDMPQSTINGQAVLQASIISPDADPQVTTNTVIDGQIIGKPGLTVLLSQDADLVFDPASVRWYKRPDFDINSPDPLPDVVQFPLPEGESGANLVGSGINIGNVLGCWPYAGYIRFKFKAVPKVQAFEIQKKVRNVTRDANGVFAENTTALINEKVEFEVGVINHSTDPMPMVLRDQLPAELRFVGSSFKQIVPNVIEIPDGAANTVFGAGLPLEPILGVGEQRIFRFVTEVITNVSNEKTVTNTAFAISGPVTISDTATVTLKPLVNLEIHKRAVNVTSGQETAPKQVDGKNVLAVDARAGDIIDYYLTTIALQQPIPGFIVEDGIADILEYADVVSVSDSGEVVGGTAGNNAKIVRWPAVDLIVGQPLTVTFTVKVKNPLPSNPPKGFSFDDKLYNEYGDIVIVLIQRPAPEVRVPSLKVEKLVRNFTANEADFIDANEAFSGDTLEYLVKFSNVGNGPADQVKFSDTLPPNTQFLPGTTIISRNGGPEKTLIDGITANGIIIDTIPSGDSSYIKFKVLTARGIGSGEVLENKVCLVDDDKNICDTAKTKIKAVPAVPQQPQIPTPPPFIPSLPRTGPATSATFLLTLMVGVALSYIRYRKLIAEEVEVGIISRNIARL